MARAGRNISGVGPTDANEAAAQVLSQIGEKLRAARLGRGLTLQALSRSVNLTPSMLSLVERGRSIPSIASLIAISHALGVSVGDLTAEVKSVKDDIVIRAGEAPLVETPQRLLRRLLRDDAANGALISTTCYRPKTTSAPHPRGHAGFEHGYVLEGELTVELEGKIYVLYPGDLISYNSNRPHRISNRSKKDAYALWINFRTERSAGF